MTARKIIETAHSDYYNNNFWRVSLGWGSRRSRCSLGFLDRRSCRCWRLPIWTTSLRRYRCTPRYQRRRWSLIFFRRRKCLHFVGVMLL